MYKQPLFNEHKEIVYNCLYEYLRKSEESCSYVRKQVLKISTNEGHSSDICIQSGMFCTGSSLPLLTRTLAEKGFPWFKIPENRFKVLRSQQKISELPDESEDIFKKNMPHRYMDRPDEKFQNRKLALMNFSYYSEFLRYHYVSTISNENDWQSVELTDDVLETNLAVTSYYLSVILLIHLHRK